MDLSAFFGVVSTVEFALLGLWWVAVQARADLRRREAGGLGMAYLVSLQFVVPGTASLLAQVAPGLAVVWRVSFAVAGLCGLAAIVILLPMRAGNGRTRMARAFNWGAAPLYVVVTVIAAVPSVLNPFSSRLNALQVEAALFCLMIFLSSQTAWMTAMAPDEEAMPSAGQSAQDPVRGV